MTDSFWSEARHLPASVRVGMLRHYVVELNRPVIDRMIEAGWPAVEDGCFDQLIELISPLGQRTYGGNPINKQWFIDAASAWAGGMHGQTEALERSAFWMMMAPGGKKELAPVMQALRAAGLDPCSILAADHVAMTEQLFRSGFVGDVNFVDALLPDTFDLLPVYPGKRSLNQVRTLLWMAAVEDVPATEIDNRLAIGRLILKRCGPAALAQASNELHQLLKAGSAANQRIHWLIAFGVPLTTRAARNFVGRHCIITGNLDVGRESALAHCVRAHYPEFAVEVLTMAKRSGIDFNDPVTSTHHLPLQLAVNSERWPVAQTLLRFGADPTRTSITPDGIERLSPLEVTRKRYETEERAIVKGNIEATLAIMHAAAARKAAAGIIRKAPGEAP